MSFVSPPDVIQDRKYFGIDLVRIFAAAIVLLNHFGQYDRNAPQTSDDVSSLAFPFLDAMNGIGDVGVEIFFVISGFVISMSISNATTSQFFLNRTVRIFPALLISSLIAFGLRALSGEPPAYLLSCFLRSMVLSPVGPYIDGVVWSLVIEAVFYAAIALVVRRYSDGISRMAYGLGIYSGLFVVVMIADALHPSAPVADLLYRFFCKVLLLPQGVFFSLGMLVFTARRQGGTMMRTMAIAALVVLGAAEIYVSSAHAEFRSAATEGKALIRTLIWLGAILLIFVSVRFAPPIARTMGGWADVSRNLGLLSYPLYLNHYVFGMVITHTLLVAGLRPIDACAVTISASVLTSCLIAFGPERWGQRLLRSFFLRSRVGHPCSS